jgi:hypothetical protein
LCTVCRPPATLSRRRRPSPNDNSTPSTDTTHAPPRPAQRPHQGTRVAQSDDTHNRQGPEGHSLLTPSQPLRSHPVGGGVRPGAWLRCVT